MARLARVVGIGLPHHVTQRGNARQFILAADEERLVYLDLFRQYSRLHQLSVLGYCLMSNPVHLIVAGASEVEIAAIRESTHTGRPLGSSEFVTALEKSLGRPLAPQKGGRQATPETPRSQRTINFD
jgi:hypothetical protein